MYYILHGDEEFRRSEAVARLKSRMISDGMGDLNIMVLDGRTVGLNELIDACKVIPFLTNRRLVIVEGLLQRIGPRASSRAKQGKGRSATAGEGDYAEKLAACLPDLPPFTRLVFVESKSLARNHPILASARNSGEAYVREFKPLRGGELQDWIRRKSREKRANISRDAVSMLVSFVGPNLRLLDQELEKLAGLVNYSRPITGDDVKALVTAARDNNVFALVDALGLRNRARAVQQLQELVASGASALYLLAMMARQVRLILSVKDLVQEKGLGLDEIRRELRISREFIVRKLLRQAEWFSVGELERIQRRMLDIDQAIKTGQIEGHLALELLVVEICRKEPGGLKRAYQGRRAERTRLARSSSSASPEQRSRYN